MIEPITRSGAQVVVVTGSEDRARWGDAIRSGARKVLSKTEPLYDIIATVRRIMTGLPVMDREEREELVSESARSGRSCTVSRSGSSSSRSASARCSATS